LYRRENKEEKDGVPLLDCFPWDLPRFADPAVALFDIHSDRLPKIIHTDLFDAVSIRFSGSLVQGF
jgi:hypothetical protein